MAQDTKKEFVIEATCRMNLYWHNNKPAIESSECSLAISDQKDPMGFYLEDGTLSASGYKAMLNCFIQGIIGSVRGAAHDNYFEEGPLLQWTVDEIGKAFVAQTDIITH